MQRKCNSAAFSVQFVRGLCKYSANAVQARRKTLNTARAVRRFLLLADAEVLEEALGLLAVSDFCSARPASPMWLGAEMIDLELISAPGVTECFRLLAVSLRPVRDRGVTG
jgi:hypothetical protein